MRVLFRFCAALAFFLNSPLFCFADNSLPPAQPASSNQLSHAWRYISYPNLIYQGTNFLSFLVSPNNGRELRLDILTYGIHPPAMLRKGNVSARLHHADGLISDIEEKYRPFFEHPMGASSGSSLDGGMDFSIMALFPWRAKALEECWFEVHIGMEHYWIELPYGFDQDPNNISPQSISGAPPQIATAMKESDAHDHIVRWEYVQYDLGHLPGDWYVSLNQSNSVRASSEVVLYRENWKDRSLYVPRTSVRILDADGSVLNGRCWDIHLVDDGMRRSDTFYLPGTDDKLRSWGQMEISVDTNICRSMIPSSLYTRGHGHAAGPR